jgi:hypothetical protein
MPGVTCRGEAVDTSCPHRSVKEHAGLCSHRMFVGFYVHQTDNQHHPVFSGVAPSIPPGSTSKGSSSVLAGRVSLSLSLSVLTQPLK